MNKTNKNKTSFSAIVKLPYEVEVTVDVELDKDECHLTYDEVEDAIYKKVNDEYGCPGNNCADIEEFDEDEFPHIIDIVINDDGESYPVISESMDDNELKKNGVVSKYLVLPDAVYSLTPEAKLWMDLKKNGIIDEDAPFNFEKYHMMVEKTSK